jgi:hypothetical protein
VAWLALTLPAPAQAGEACYVLMFGAQQIPNRPNYSHSFATFVRVTWPGNGPCPGRFTIEAHTISWLPRNLVIRTLALLPECGYNFDLDTTLRYVLSNDERVSMWGPYQIHPDLYCRALRQIARLESGQLKYKADDTGWPARRVSNCIHALSEVVNRPLLLVASPGWGEMASYYVLREYRPWLVDEEQKHYWVSQALGLDCYPIIYRQRIVSPRSGILGPLYRILGGERDLEATYGPPQ